MVQSGEYIIYVSNETGENGFYYKKRPPPRRPIHGSLDVIRNVILMVFLHHSLISVISFNLQIKQFTQTLVPFLITNVIVIFELPQ